jgi:hypothetical protein
VTHWIDILNQSYNRMYKHHGKLQLENICSIANSVAVHSLLPFRDLVTMFF